MTAARTRAQAAQGRRSRRRPRGILGQALGRLFAVAEAYPELQADENFQQLQDELAQTENRIAVSRQVYNDTVLTYNNAIQTVPGVSSPACSASRSRTSSRSEDAGPGGATRRVLAARVVARRRSLLARGRRRRSRSRCPPRTSSSRSSRTASLLVDEGSRSPSTAPSAAPTARSRCATGETLDQVAVSEGDDRYRPGASAELGCAGAAGHVRDRRETDKGVRIVWHYRANSEQRDASDPLPAARGRGRLRRRRRRQPPGLGRRVGGRARASSRRRSIAPGRHPAAPGATRLRARRRHARRQSREPPRARHSRRPVRRAARALPPPRVHLDGRDAGRNGPGLAQIVAEERDDAAAYERDQRKIDEALDNLPRTLAILLALALGPALALIALRLVALRPRARDGVRPRVRAGAADRDAARARAAAAAPGRRPARSSSPRRSST